MLAHLKISKGNWNFEQFVIFIQAGQTCSGKNEAGCIFTFSYGMNTAGCFYKNEITEIDEPEWIYQFLRIRIMGSSSYKTRRISKMSRLGHASQVLWRTKMKYSSISGKDSVSWCGIKTRKYHQSGIPWQPLYSWKCWGSCQYIDPTHNPLWKKLRYSE